MKSLTLLLFISHIWITASAQSIIYVDANNNETQNGQSWSTAFNDLQQAIDSAIIGDTIFVAKGVYYPSQIAGSGSNERAKTFLIGSHSRIYGGFEGNYTSVLDAFVIRDGYADSSSTLSIGVKSEMRE